MGRVAEEFFDHLFFLGISLGTLLFFLLYWKYSFEMRYAEALLQSFLVQTSIEGVFSAQEYSGLRSSIKQINSKLDVELEWIGYRDMPVYAKLPQNQITSYYFGRNVRKEKSFRFEEVFIEETDINSAKLQEETNASILADGKSQYLPLPDEVTNVSVCAVRPSQRVYEGEELITLCLVHSESGDYYAQAQPVYAQTSGSTMLSLWIEGSLYETEVSVECLSRTLYCVNGHCFANTKEQIERSDNGQEVICPYCSKIPKQITINGEMQRNLVGVELSQIISGAEVCFLDGHKEMILPGAEGWQDDYDKNFCGIQKVRILYYGAETETVVVLEGRACHACGQVCTGRSYEDYCSFPYCEQCMTNVELFAGMVYTELQKKNVQSVLDFVREHGSFEMEKGDILIGYIKHGKKLDSVWQQKIENNRK